MQNFSWAAKIKLLQKKNIIFRQALFACDLFPTQINYVVFSGYVLDLQIKKNFFYQIINFFAKSWFWRYQTLVDIVGIDFPFQKARFRLVYAFVSYDVTSRLLVSINVREKETFPSVFPLYPGAGWLEREVWDFFGIFFRGNPDLRRILTDYGFVGHPLRKDFPLSGFSEIVYDDRKKQIIYHPVSLAQEFRNFRVINPWSLL